MKAYTKIRIKLFLLTLCFELAVNSAILFTAYFVGKLLETLLFYMPFHLLRKAVPKVLHVKGGKPIYNLLGCGLFSYLCYLVAMKLMPPVNISILFCVLVGIFINFVLYKIQDYLDLKREVAKHTTDIYKMTEEELRNYAKSKGLSEMIIDTLVLRVIHNYRWVEIRNERNYTRRGIDYHKETIEKKLNIKL